MSFLRSLGDTPEQLHAQHTRQWCREVDGVEEVAECREGTRRRVVGEVESIKLVPSEHSNTLEITVYDGTDRIVGVWLGRRSIPGIDLGSHLVLEGTVGRFAPGPLRIINPAYELLVR